MTQKVPFWRLLQPFYLRGFHQRHPLQMRPRADTPVPFFRLEVFLKLHPRMYVMALQGVFT